MAAFAGAGLMAELLPFSLSQQEVWLDQRTWPDSTHLNIGGAGFIDGKFDLGVFRQAFQLLIEECEALRLVPRLDEGGQWLLPAYTPDLPVIQMPASDDPRAAMQAWWQAWMKTPYLFDGKTPPWRFALLRHSDELHGLSIQFHHLIMDGWGTSRIMQRWAVLYNALAEGAPIPVSGDPGYRRYIEDSLDYRQSAAFEKDQAFWQAQLPALPAPLFEMRYRQPCSLSLPEAHNGTVGLARSAYDRIGLAAAGQGMTLFSYLVAVLAVYFHRTTRRRDIVIALPSLNRSGKRFLATPGMFVGVFPLVLRIDAQSSVAQLLAQVQSALKASVRYQRYPLSELGRELGTLRQRRDSLFDILFSFERQDYKLHFGEGTSAGARQTFSGLARYPLGLTLCEFQAVQDQDVELTLEAHPAYFAADEVGLIGKRIWYLAQTMLDDPEAALATLDIVPPSERQHLLVEIQPATGAPGGIYGETEKQPYIRHFIAQATRVPEAVAVVWDGGELNYGQLLSQACHLATELHAQGVARDRIVAVAMARSVDQLVALLAVNLAGGAFLPLDPDAPVARLALILDDSQAICMITDPELAPRFVDLQTPLLHVDANGRGLLNEPLVSALPALSDLAYVLFTSGSTGTPKGVMVEHEALAIRLDWIGQTYGIRADDRTGQCTQATFDPALIEFFLPLINGASIALPPPGRIAPNQIGPFVARFGVSILALVPATVQGLLASLPEGEKTRLRNVCCGGEVLAPELAQRFVAATGANLFNVYGPTETAIFATAWPCRDEISVDALPIGRVIAGARVYILDDHGNLLPGGVTGEIYLGGRAVARGYLNRPELNASAFLQDPFSLGGRMYRTGDRGWLDGDGVLHFVGRTDRQVKLRGYRIELGEIESALLAVAGVTQAAVKLIVGSDERRFLHAWVAGDGLPAADRLRASLAGRLPDYMLPSGFSTLAELPLTSSGKVAYDLLPEPVVQGTEHSKRLPSTAMALALLQLWQRVMKRDDLGVADNFFEAGGDSLAAVDILAGIETLLGRRVPLFLLTEHPTIESLAHVLDQHSATAAVAEQIMIPLGRHTGAVPLYFAASGHGDLIRLQNLAKALAGACDLFMLQPPVDGEIKTIEAVASLYAEKIVAYGRPGFLAGFSVGGVVAVETTRMLLRANATRLVHKLILVDAVFPGRVIRSAILWRILGFLASKSSLQALTLNGRHLGGLLGDSGLVAQINAMREYQPKPLDIQAVLVRSRGMMRWERWAFLPWRKVISGLSESDWVEGMHGSIFEHGLQELVAAIRAAVTNG